MKIFKFLFLSLLLLVAGDMYAGFIAGTLVKVPDGYTAIETLASGDTVCSFDKQGDVRFSKIKRTISYVSPRSVTLELQDDVIVAAPVQQYFISTSNIWQEAETIAIDTKLCSLYNEQISIQAIKEVDKSIRLFDIQLEDIHTFCVTKQDIVVHNFPAFFIGLSFVFGEGIVFEGIKAGCCIVGMWLGAKICKKNGGNKNSDREVQLTASCDICPDQFDINDYIYLDESIEDILTETTPGPKTKGRAKQYVKPGGYDDAIKDFDKLGPISVEDMPGKKGKIGILSDGRKINVRVDSTDKRPTLEIQNPDNTGKTIKIRYDASQTKE